jgi:hypothetical protein
LLGRSYLEHHLSLQQNIQDPQYPISADTTAANALRPKECPSANLTPKASPYQARQAAIRQTEQ